MKAVCIALNSLALSFFALLWNGVVHLAVLKTDNRAVEGIHRPDMAGKIWISVVVTVLISSAFSLSYSRWRKKGTLRETLAHSSFFAFLMIAAVDLNQYVLYSIPFDLVAKWAAFGYAEFLIYGLISRKVFGRMLK